MSHLRTAVVGVGALGRHHARILSDMPGAELVAVVDSHEVRGREAAEKHHTRWVSNYHEILDQVDAASIVVPTVAHGDVAGDFLRRGIAVFVEKPLADTAGAARALVELAERQRVTLQVGHVERFNPAWQAALPLCTAPKYIRAERCSPFTFRSTDIGVVLDMMIHDIDLILSLVRCPLRRVEAFGLGLMSSHEDCVQARLTFDNGCIADLTASRLNPQVRRAMQVWSLNGCVAIDFQQRTVSRTTAAEMLRGGMSPVDLARQPGADIEALKARVFAEFLPTEEISVPAGDALTSELASFVNCVRSGLHPHCDGRQALHAIQVADRILQEVATHEWDGHAHGAVGPHPARTQRRAA